MQKRCSRPSDPVSSYSGHSGEDAACRPLIEVFGTRPKRFDLLMRGAGIAGVGRDDFVVEAGCAYGAAALFLAGSLGCRVLGVDCDARQIAVAVKTLDRVGATGVSFAVGRAEGLPLNGETVDFIVSEASFSLLADKARAAAEYGRVLKPGGQVIMNDFIVRGHVDEALRRQMRYIPCFAGVRSGRSYQDIFERAGFATRTVTDTSSELIKTALWISKAYGGKPADISRILASLMGGPPAEGCTPNELVCKEFLRQARLAYAQLIFMKET